MTDTQSTITLIGALAKALPEIGSVAKNKANPAFKVGGKVSKYADLSAIIDALEPIRSHGLWYRQFAHEHADGAMVETFYIHESGEELSAGTAFMPASKRDAQGFGSALTYCRRYGLQTAFGLATEDDDGNAAAHRQQDDEPPPKPAPDAFINDTTRDWLAVQIQASGSDVAAFCRENSIMTLKELTNARAAELAKALKKKAA